PSQHRGAPHGHEPLPLPLQAHISRGTLNPNTVCSYGVDVVSGGFGALANGVGSANVSFSCTKTQGAVLSLPVIARREDTLHQDLFRRWILKHIKSWFAFARQLGMGIEMEDIILVTGCHRTTSWTNTVFNEAQTNVGVSLGVEVGVLDASVNWRASNIRIQGAIVNGPTGRNLPENQCIFIRGFRVKRFFFGLVPRIKAAAEPKPDTRGNDPEPEKEGVPIPSVTKYQDPMHVLLEYIAKQVPDCDMALVHDDDLERVLRAGDRTSLETLNPNVMMGYLERWKPEIGVMSDPFLANDQSPRTDTGHTNVAMLSEHLKSSDPVTSGPLVTHLSGGTTNREKKVHCLLEAQESATKYTVSRNDRGQVM
ncbi:hypothetical protein EDB87DRAFT_1589299, partial [Lactarius vividus]